MSETEVLSETSSIEHNGSDTDTVPFDKVGDILTTAAADAIALKDYLSFSTVIDIYLGDPSKYTTTEQDTMLGQLHEILTANPELTYEIGWDLPSILVPYLNSDYDFSASLRSAPVIYKVIKIIETLAKEGNPKELFLKSCELLTTMQLDDPALEGSQHKEQTFDLKIYCVFELIDSCLKRIKTLYPSRFLAMTVASFVNLVYSNPLPNSHITYFLLKRAYSFARNYSTLPLPDTSEGEDLELIKKTEEILQQRLLTAFLTQTVALVGQVALLGFAIDHFTHMLGCRLINDQEFDVQLQVMDRLYELALSYDMELSATFNKYLKDANVLLDSIDYSSADVTGDVFEKVILDYQTNIAHVIVNSDANTINDSIPGTLTLYTYHIATLRLFDEASLSVKDAIALTIRAIIPGMVRPSFLSANIQDIVVFWSWYSLHTKLSLEVEFAKVEKELLAIYYQVLLFLVINNEVRVNLRYITLTLLTKVLALSPESTAYLFLIDSLHNCPDESVKAALVGIVKELLTKEKSVEEISDKLEKTQISGAPPLPSRESKPATTFFTLDQKKVKDIFELITISIEETFVEEDGTSRIDPLKLGQLSAYLNLLVILKREPVLIENKSLLDDTVTKVEQSIAQIKEKHKDNSLLELNAAEMLNITIERIKS